VSSGSDLHFYFPLSNRFVLAIKNGFANVTGDPEFYQLNPIGGRKLRGYRRERFWGNTTYYNNNELQYLFNFKSFLFNGKAGLMAFADQGRVWLKNDKSDIWHYG
jgi:hemolysin activation/secretion protein